MGNFDVEQVMMYIKQSISDKRMSSQDLSYTTGYHKRAIKYLKSCKQIIIFGAGKFGKLALEDFRQNEIKSVLCFCDNKVNEEKMDGLRIISPEEAVKTYPDACFVVTPQNYENEILMQLTDLGIPVRNIRIFNVKSAGLTM